MFQDQLPDLFDHFMDMGLEAHMYASQWFLTLFTAKFPLYMVFHILDLFLCDVRIYLNITYNYFGFLIQFMPENICKLLFASIIKDLFYDHSKKYFEWRMSIHGFYEFVDENLFHKHKMAAQISDIHQIYRYMK